MSKVTDATTVKVKDAVLTTLAAWPTQAGRAMKGDLEQFDFLTDITMDRQHWFTDARRRRVETEFDRQFALMRDAEDKNKAARHAVEHGPDESSEYPAAALETFFPKPVSAAVREPYHGILPPPLDPYYDHIGPAKASFDETYKGAVAKAMAGKLSTDAKARKALPVCTGVLDYFPRAMAAVAEVSRIGNDQHNPGQPLHWAMGKSTDHADCAVRHLMERGTRDVDGGRHSAKAAWRVLALLEVECLADEAGMTFDAYIKMLNDQEKTGAVA